jgi:hypothetical protein
MRSETKKPIWASSVLCALCCLLVLGFVSAASADAATGPIWRIESVSNSTAQAGDLHRFILQISNIGDSEANGGAETIEFTASLPDGISAKSIAFQYPPPFGPEIPVEWLGVSCSGDGSGGPPGIEGAHQLTCSTSAGVEAHQTLIGLHLLIVGEVDPGAEGTLVTHFTVSGGGASEASWADPTRIADEASFGIRAFDSQLTDSAGGAVTAAGSHPFSYATSLEFESRHNPDLYTAIGPAGQDAYPVEGTQNVALRLPPGLIGNPTAFPKCDAALLAEELNSCPLRAQVGEALVRLNNPIGVGTNLVGPFPVYSLVPPHETPAFFGFKIYGNIVTMKARLRSESDFGLSVLTPKIPQGLDAIGTTVTIWGTPADPRHDSARACPGAEGYPEYVLSTSPSCASEPPVVPFLRMPTSCTAPGEGLPFLVAIDSWQHPGALSPGGEPDLADPAWATAQIETHQAPGYPLAPDEWGQAVGVDNCAHVPFRPRLQVVPTTDAADSPTGLSVGLTVPQDCWSHAEETCDSDLRKAAIRLPAGMSVNPSAAAGQGACSSQQIGLLTPLGSTPIHFTDAPQSCPDAAKIGKAELTTPLLDHTLNGSVYLAKQGDNPFGSLLAMYLVIEDPQSGTIVKLPGRVLTNEATGRLETVFDEGPQLPFEHLGVDLFGGPRAALRTPPRCGTFAAQGTFTPWSGNPPVRSDSGFDITQGPGGGACPSGGFDPQLSAGTQNPLAGSYSPFHLRLTREDATQELAGLSATLAPGLIGKPAGIPYCSDSVLASYPAETLLGTGAGEIASPKCPAASQVGTVTVGAGAGVNPFYTSSGKAYLAGPYKGAPLSLAVVTPAVAGPFDLGTVVVRNALRIDPETAQITAVSDPLPTILHGIPLDLRDVRVDLNRPDFTLNPTSCEPKTIDAALTSVQGATANRSVRFQAADCDRLGFKPKLSLKLKGGTKRGENPALTAVMRPRAGDANASSIQVSLPHSEFLAQDHIKTICTRVQFAADACPKGSIYGKVTATSPILDYPLTGNVYLRSSSHNLPDLVLALKGPASQPIEIDAVARIDSVKGGIRTSFAQVPDAPLTKVVLRMPGGRKSLLENSRDICATHSRAQVQIDAHNGRTEELRPALGVRCAKAKRHRHHHR